jgi:hypothetical protein
MSTSGVLNNTGTLMNSAILKTVITLNGGALTLELFERHFGQSARQQ